MGGMQSKAAGDLKSLLGSNGYSPATVTKTTRAEPAPIPSDASC